MQRFSDFAEDPEILDGNKIRIDDVLNRELVVTGYSVKDSKYSKIDILPAMKRPGFTVRVYNKQRAAG
jgi:hypothetical protein